MDDCYLKIMKQLNYDVPTAKTLVDLCRGSHGDYSDMGFKYIIDAAKTVSHLDFKSNILLLSDRLYGVAIGMHYFFRRCTDADVECAMYDGQDVLSAINSRDIDFLILAGYLRTEVNKEILAKIREQKNPPQIVMWAGPDKLIYDFCTIHQIKFLFDRWKPVGDFVEYLKSLQS